MSLQPSVNTQLSFSTKSLSETSADNTARKKHNMLSSLFPFFEQITSQIKLPEILYNIVVLIVTWQTVYTAFWTAKNQLWADQKDVMNVLNIVATFCPLEPTFNDILIIFIVLTALLVITIGMFLIQFITFKNFRRFNIPSLYPTKFLMEIISTIVIFPSANLISESFDRLQEKFDHNDIIVFIFCVIDFIGFLFIFLYSYNLIGQSAYLGQTVIAAFNVTPYVHNLIAISILYMLYNVFSLFPLYTRVFVVIIHLLGSCVMLYMITYRPFISLNMNKVFFFTTINGILMDILYFISLMMNLTNDIIGLVVFGIFLVISIALSVIFFEIQNKSVKRSLKQILEESNNEDGNTNEEFKEKDSGKRTNNHLFDEVYNFSSLKLEKSQLRALFYIEFIVSYGMTEFLFSIFPHVLTLYNTKNCKIRVLRLLVFFPSESRYMSIVLRNLYQQRNFSMKDRFLLYQVERIKTFRLSTSSNSAAERIHELRQVTKDLENFMRTFWLQSISKIGFLNSVSKEIRKADALWEESLAEFPNSTCFGEEKIRFMIECATNFTSAIREKHHVELIESGSHLYKDICFRRFAGTFTKYLKNKILDMHGNFICKSKAKKGSQSASSNNSGMKFVTSTSSSNSDLDVNVEEEIGKTLLTRARIRLALQHATQNRRANSLMIVTISNFVLLAVAVAIFLFIYIYFNGYFDNRNSNMVLISNINQIRLYMFSSQLTLFSYWGIETGATPITATTSAAQQVDQTNESFFPSKALDNVTMIFQESTKMCFEELVNTVASLSKAGVNVFAAANSLFQPITDMKFCTEQGSPKYTYKMNLKSSLIYQLAMTMVVIADEDLPNWFSSSTHYCSLTSSMFAIAFPIRDIRTTMSEMISDESLKSEKLVKIMMITFPIIYILMATIMTLIAYIIYKKELVAFMKMLHKFPEDSKNEAINLLIKNADDNDTVYNFNENNTINSGSNHNTSSKDTFFILYLFIIIVFYIGIAVIIFFEFQNINSYNSKFQNLILWSTDSSLRSSLVSELTLWVLFAATLKHPYVSLSKFLTVELISTNVDQSYNSLDLTSKKLLSDFQGYPSIYGLDPIVDTLMLTEVCQANSEDASFHEMYRCGSSQQLITFFLNTIWQTMTKLDEFTGTVTDEVTSSLLHMLSTHLNPFLLKIDDRLAELQNVYIKDFEYDHIVYLLCEIIVAFITLVFGLLLTMEMNKCYKIALILLRRLSPIAITSQSELLYYLLDKSKDNNSSEMSVDQNIIFSSADSIICLNNNLMIEILNPAVSKTFGFTPEQLLGQSVLTLFNPSSTELFEQQITLILHRQSALTYYGHAQCIADDDSQIPCAITILGIEDDSHQIHSFVIILRDETTVLQQQEEAERRKKESESLLYQILPRDIVVRLNQGEKDISFTVPSATIMFIDIVKFSEYSANLTPQEIMGNLSMIFCGFDEFIVKYSTLLKIKLIGDVYMAAGGIFCKEDTPQVHAEQMVRFGLECLQVLDETNVKLNAVLNVRIGVNTGGPLIAGVLGTDKPTFDIIGDPINIASRLQSTDIASRIQISQRTYELIQNMDFQIEPRGEIFLKGKGKMPTYIVSLNRQYIFQVSSSDIQENAPNNNSSSSANAESILKNADVLLNS